MLGEKFGTLCGASAHPATSDDLYQGGVADGQGQEGGYGRVARPREGGRERGRGMEGGVRKG